MVASKEFWLFHQVRKKTGLEQWLSYGVLSKPRISNLYINVSDEYVGLQRGILVLEQLCFHMIFILGINIGFNQGGKAAFLHLKTTALESTLLKFF